MTDSNGETKGKITLTGWFCLSLLIWLSFLYTSMYLQCVCLFVCFGFSFAADRAHLSFNCQTRVRAVGSLSFSLDPVYCQLVEFFCVYVILNKYIYFLCSVCMCECVFCVYVFCLSIYSLSCLILCHTVSDYFDLLLLLCSYRGYVPTFFLSSCVRVCLLFSSQMTCSFPISACCCCCCCGSYY